MDKENWTFAREKAKRKFIQLSEAFRDAAKNHDGHRARILGKRIGDVLGNGGKPRCPDCGFRIRGDNHFENEHHERGKKK